MGTEDREENQGSLLGCQLPATERLMEPDRIAHRRERKMLGSAQCLIGPNRSLKPLLQSIVFQIHRVLAA